MDKEELINIVHEMSLKEEEYARELRELATKFKHPVLQALILGISKDSEKHSIFYKSIEELLRKTQPLITEEELEIIKKGIRKHIKMEAQMIEFTKNILDKVNDPRLRLVFSAIYEDEVKHHKLLIDIERNIAERETFAEEDLWEAVWRDSPWHGTPGG